MQFLKSVGPRRAAAFAELGVRTLRDLLFTFPRSLSDRSAFSSIAKAPPGETVAFLVRLIEVRTRELRRGRLRHITVARFADDTGEIEARWFNSPWIAEKLGDGLIMLYGKTKREGGCLRLDHPQYEILAEADNAQATLSIGRIVPIYPCTGCLTQFVWRKAMQQAIEKALPMLAEIHPPEFLAARGLPDRRTAVRDMHFPGNAAARERAAARLIYDECLFMQLAILRLRQRVRNEYPGRVFRVTTEIDERIRRLFPFCLTAAQERCVAEIAADMAAPRPMHRLLQGDVGSGKTAVATYAMLVAVANGCQACLMAPTTLLARQHCETIKSFLNNSPRARVRLGLLVGGMSGAEKSSLLARLQVGAVDILIATHSAIEPNIRFRDLGLVVIDEQHKFGVRQRVALVQKGIRPDTLVMTATPIPRSLALTIYGDLDVSVIDELPPGRKPVKTWIASPAREGEVWRTVRQEVQKGRQAYVVSPRLEEDEEGEIRSATAAYDNLRHHALKGLRLALLHGQMNRQEQDRVMASFRRGEVDVLVSTVVIEVGVDVANATAMVVLHAERFGLAQLHQLRGRIGRGAEAGQFILLAAPRTPEAERRLAVLERTQDGFKIAEEDLRLRGPGEFFGTRQHGLPELKLVDLVRDFLTIRQARQDALEILRRDPRLQQPQHRTLAAELTRWLSEMATPALG